MGSMSATIAANLSRSATTGAAIDEQSSTAGRSQTAATSTNPGAMTRAPVCLDPSTPHP